MRDRRPELRPGARAALACVLLGCAAAGCHRSPPREHVPEAIQPDYDKQGVGVVGEPVAPPVPRCTLASGSTHALVAPDAGSLDLSPAGGVAFARANGADWAAWIERPGTTLALAPPSGPLSRFAQSDGPLDSVEIAAVSPDRAIAVVLGRRAGGRIHRVVLASRGAPPRELFAQREGSDDALSASVIATSSGVLVAWDDLRGPAADGVIDAQFLPRAALDATAPIAPPPVLALSPEDDDADEPELVPRPDGSVVLMYLAAHDVDDDAEANATASDIYLRALSPEGTPSGEPVRVTPGPANRFGAVAVASAGAIWVAYRVAGDSDQESQGDGGLVAVVRIGADLHPTASPAYVSDRDALPSGEPAIVPDGAGAAVFWTERRGEDLHTMRRAIEPDGRVVRAALDEPALEGRLPVAGDRATSVVLVQGAGGAPSVATARCPVEPDRAR